ncbi:MAG: SpoIIE family protein phosphatase, partial [Oscillospiraceae bacterium]
LSNAAQKEFDLPEITRVCNKTKITLYEKANYSIDFYGEQVCVEGNDICGDCFEYFVDAKGYAYCILSDGMGNGKRAAIDSVMTCSILLKLIKAGFGLKSSLKLINSSLLVKSTDESLATIDLVKIDLYTGQTEFYKAGAATSYLSTKGTLVKINNDSLPIGIINDVNLKQKCIKLQTNDIILMVSDGVVENGDDWILMELASNSHLKAKEISQKILFEATKRNNEKNHDDLTVIAIKLKKRDIEKLPYGIKSIG